jgi:hypothetical protein
MDLAPRERDPQSAAEWLQNKLSGSDGWSAASISSLLTPATLNNIRDAYNVIDPDVRIKVR